MLVVALVAGSCSEATEGAPSGAGAIPSPSSESSESVPKVDDPLDVEPFLDRPCELVDPAALSKVGNFKPGSADVDSKAAKKLTGPSCSWHAKGSGPDAGLAIGTVHRDNGTGGIKGVYAGKEQGFIERLEPVEIPGHPGYPAAYAGGEDEFSRGRCPLAVGITNDLSIMVSITDRAHPERACSAVLKVAASALEALKKGS
ncbi:DUF3558 domain-containing protein [Haloechinothrix salitolerans]|uniref:DUF3558 domain-containing protein n=1 Tax=Haloechinothrix salitolerans TaxID=926830 RepID=A0ABW2C8A0_9PSEU